MTMLLTPPSDFASQLALRSLATLVPCAQNTRTHSNKQVRQIDDSIRSFGFLNPVLIDAAGEIFAGHGRVSKQAEKAQR